MSPDAAEPLPPIAGLERQTMAEVWARGGDEVTVRDVLEALNARDEKQRAYTTLMTVLARLHDKGFLTRRKQGRTLLYRAAMTEGGYLRSRASADVDAILDAYGDEALVQFARRVAAQDPRRRAQLRRLAEGGRHRPTT